MTQEEFNSIDWHRGNVAMLENGKEYLVKGTKGHGKYILLYSEEYDSSFVADHRIVAARTSDYAEPEEVYLEMKRQKREEALAREEMKRQERLKAKAELKKKHLEEQEQKRLEALAARAAKAAARLQQQKEQEKAKQEKAAKAKAKAEPQPKQPVKPKPAPVPEKPKVEAPVTPKAEAPVAEAPKKRVRQRIRISTVIREKVDIFKKK